MIEYHNGYKALGNIIISQEEIDFYQLISNGESIENAAEATFTVKRTAENRMYKLQSALGIHTKHHLIAHLIRKKIIT